MKFGVVVFPGSNCDHDAWYALGKVLHQPVEFLWHQSEDVKGFDAILLPGGFSYGDYLRTGAIARFSPVMHAVEKFARDGGFVLGICNGFQILCEAGLLPGVLQRNSGMRFVCRQVHIRGGEQRHSVHHRGQTRSGAGDADRRTAMAIIFAMRRRSAIWSASNQIVFRYTSARWARGPGRQSERFAGEYRRRMQSRTKRVGPDAASGTRGGESAGFHRRPGDFAIADRIAHAARGSFGLDPSRTGFQPVTFR